jgi:hypothetical protein
MRGKIYIQFLIFGSTLLFHLYNTWLYREKMRYICQIPEMLRVFLNSENQANYLYTHDTIGILNK